MSKNEISEKDLGKVAGGELDLSDYDPEKEKKKIIEHLKFLEPGLPESAYAQGITITCEHCGHKLNSNDTHFNYNKGCFICHYCAAFI